MKKQLNLLVLFCFVIFIAKSQSETYKPIFNGNIEFDENTPDMNEGVIYKSEHYVIRDTIINSIKYYYYCQEGSIYNYTSYYTDDGSDYYAREDTIERKVWSFNGITHSEKIMYDFSMQVGDSIYLEIAQNYNYTNPYYPASSFYQLDSITLYLLNNGDTTRKFYLHCLNQPELVPLVWIEGIGSVNNLFYTIIGIDANPLPQSLSFCKECEGTCYPYLRNIVCMLKNDMKTFKNNCFNLMCMDTCALNNSNIVDYLFGWNQYDTCQIVKVISVGITQHDVCKIKTINNIITIEEPCVFRTLTLINSYGQIVYEKNVSNQKTINFPDYFKGFYIVKLTDNNNNQVALKVILN